MGVLARVFPYLIDWVKELDKMEKISTLSNAVLGRVLDLAGVEYGRRSRREELRNL